MINKVVVKNNQSLIDVAVAKRGSFEDAIAVALINDLPVDFVPEAGTEIMLWNAAYSADRYAIIEQNPVEPATGNMTFIDPTTGEPVQGLEGIDYWAVGIDFIIQ